MKRRSCSHYQVSSTSSLSTATSLPSQHCSMGSLLLFNSTRHLYEEKELSTLPGFINTFTELPHSPPSTAAWVPFLCSTLNDTSMKRRSSSNYQVSATPSLSTAPSLPSQHYSMRSLPLFISPCHLYEQKELFTLLARYDQHLHWAQLQRSSPNTAAWGPFPCSTLHDTSMNRRSSSHYKVSPTPSLSTATSLPSQCCSMGTFPCSTTVLHQLLQ